MTRVLIVDDELSIRETLAEKALPEDGEALTLAKESEQAAVEIQLPDVLFTAGRKLHAALLQVAANLAGAAAFLAPEAEQGQPPVLWRVKTGGPPDPEVNIAEVEGN